jgi:hypothetical protein
MGYNTPVMILNDAYGQIAAHPDQFSQGIIDRLSNYAAVDAGRFSVGNHGGAVQVCQPVHSSSIEVIAFGGNMTVPIGAHNPDIAKALATTSEHYRQYLIRCCDTSIRQGQAMLRALNAPVPG